MFDVSNRQLEDEIEHIREELSRLSERVSRLDHEICDDRGYDEDENRQLWAAIQKLRDVNRLAASALSSTETPTVATE